MKCSPLIPLKLVQWESILLTTSKQQIGYLPPGLVDITAGQFMLENGRGFLGQEKHQTW